MADITKCKGKDCPFKEQCYRYTAPTDEWQSWFVESPIKINSCDMFWSNKEIGVINTLDSIIRGKQ